MEAFEELKCIGRGSYGAAFLVRTRDSGEQRVVKKVSISLLGEEEQEQAHREVELLQELDHPNIVDFFDHFIANDELHIVMLYCEGGDLSTRIKEAIGEAYPGFKNLMARRFCSESVREMLDRLYVAESGAPNLLDLDPSWSISDGADDADAEDSRCEEEEEGGQ